MEDRTHHRCFAPPVTRLAYTLARGFTLVELMITITIGAILLSLAVPAFDELLRGYRLTAQTNQVVSALHFAKAEAARSGARVSLRALADDTWGGVLCIVVANRVIDLNADGDVADAGENMSPIVTTGSPLCPGVANVLRGLPAGNGNITVTRTSGNTQLISFEPTGQVSSGNAVLQLCHDGSNNCRQIAVNTSGRIAASEIPRPVEETEPEEEP